MQDIIRESWFGQAVNRFSKGKYFPFPEDKADFQIPPHFLLPHQREKHAQQSRTLSVETTISTRAPSPLPNAHRRDSDQQTLADGHAQDAIERTLQGAKEGLEEGKDANLVGWYSESDPENPQYAY